MSFNKENLVGIAQKSISANNYEESKASNIALDTHIENQGVHVSFEDRKRWNEQSRYLKDYVDYRFKTIIGKFKFEALNVSNKFTLVDVILHLYNKILTKFNKESAERTSIMQSFIDKIERMVRQDILSRQAEIQAVLELIDELNAALAQEIKDRKENDDLEIKARQNAINTTLNYVNEQVEILQTEDKRLDDLIKQEAFDRDQAIQVFEEDYTKAMNQYAVELQNILDRMENLLSGKEAKILELESRIIDLEDRLNRQ